MISGVTGALGSAVSSYGTMNAGVDPGKRSW